MLLLPFEKLTIHTYLSRASVKGRLEAVTASRTTFWRRVGFNLTDKPFMGKVEKDSFQMVLNDGYSRLVCSGYIEKADRGSNVILLLRPLAINFVISMMFYIMAWFSLINFLIWLPRLLMNVTGSIEKEIPWWMVFPSIITYLFLYLWHRYHGNKAKKILRVKLAEK